MSGKKRTRSIGDAVEGVKCLQIEAVVKGFSIGNGNNGEKDDSEASKGIRTYKRRKKIEVNDKKDNSETSKCVQTYKRRKKTRSVLLDKGQEDINDRIVSIGNPTDEIVQEPGVCFRKTESTLLHNGQQDTEDHAESAAKNVEVGEPFQKTGLSLLHEGQEIMTDQRESAGKLTNKLVEEAGDCFHETGLSLLHNGQEDVKDHKKSIGSTADKTVEEQGDHLISSSCSLDCLNDNSFRQCRGFILETMYQSLSDDEVGVRGCIRRALMMSIKESDVFVKDKRKWEQDKGPVCNGSAGESGSQTITEICRQAFLNIILSDQFGMLCKLLFENLHEAKLDNLGLGLINSRMNEGSYGSSHVLFHADIEQLQRKLQGFGDKLISLAKNLSHMSRTCLKEKLAGSIHLTSVSRNHEVGALEFDSHYEREQPETEEACSIDKACICRHCGDKTEEKNRLVCDYCEEIYHIFCIEHNIMEEAPAERWYCSSCVGKGLPPESSVVNETVSVSRTRSNRQYK